MASALLVCSVGLCQSPDHNKKDKSVHHAAMHAEDWVNRRVSAPHGKNAIRRKKNLKHKANVVHHGAMHTEHWIDHHVSAPHKKKAKAPHKGDKGQ